MNRLVFCSWFSVPCVLFLLIDLIMFPTMSGLPDRVLVALSEWQFILSGCGISPSEFFILTLMFPS